MTETQPVSTQSARYRSIANLQVDETLAALVETEILPGTGVDAADFWRALADLVTDFGPRNRELLEIRDRFQQRIDEWHRERRGQALDPAGYRKFLEDIGYLEPEPVDVAIDTAQVDPEVARIAGPQLVVPVKNARFALNAANARWGSLYDALYGTDVIGEEDGATRAGPYNPRRGEKVIARARAFLDDYFPLQRGSHGDARGYRIEAGHLVVTLDDHVETGLRDTAALAGYRGEPTRPDAVLLVHNGLHAEVQIDPEHPVGRTDAAGVSDVVLEAALTTIMDAEDSVAAVDAADKVEVYRNWLELMRGTLEEEVAKGEETFTRRLHPDREYRDPAGQAFSLPGRSLLFVRNVGHLMTTPAVLDGEGREIPEGILDGLVTAACGIHDLKGNGELRNSRAGSIYIVKPKMHGSEEVAFSNDLFDRIEDALGLSRHTLKMGLMDEERRTSLNLKACIAAARHRVMFINTGFLDRTGDEIHTSMEAGPFAPKGELKKLPWIQAYEKSNVVAGLSCGFRGRAQIGKGMWAMPDLMAAMLEAKSGHPEAGANTAWVPSPTAATLHAIHYHQVDVPSVQAQLEGRGTTDIDTMLEIPLLGDRTLEEDAIRRELDNNIQGILGYVVRWVDQGVGCSKVPDIDNVALMEDRATLRIASQHVCNWLYHGVCTEQQVRDCLARMASVVDRQNRGDPEYRPMAPLLDDHPAFAAARDLIFRGREQPSGYTEPLLHRYRLDVKAGA